MSEIIIGQKACPLLMNESMGGVLNCVGNKCQWWLNEARDCTLPMVARALFNLQQITDEKVGGTD